MLAEIAQYFDLSSPPVVFQRLAAGEGLLEATWQQYSTVMRGGELKANDKELIGLAVATTKSNDYLVGLQRRRLRQLGIETEKESEALAVVAFFEGFDAFAHALRVDSDLRPRRLAAGDMSLIDREVDVNVPYVSESQNPLVRQVYDEIRTSMRISFVPNIFKALAHQPEMLRAKWESYKATMGRGKLRRLTKELIAIAVSAVNACFY